MINRQCLVRACAARETYPNAQFTSTCVQGLPANYGDGQAVKFQIIGNLTLHGKNNKEVFDVQGIPKVRELLREMCHEVEESSRH